MRIFMAARKRASSDAEDRTLGVDYNKYDNVATLKEAEAYSTRDYQVSAKWFKILSHGFDPNRDCSTLCLQHKTNEVLWHIYQEQEIPAPAGEKPNHINFI